MRSPRSNDSTPTDDRVAELETEVKRLRLSYKNLVDRGTGCITRAEAAEAEVERLHRRETEMAMLASEHEDRAEAAEARLDAVRALHSGFHQCIRGRWWAVDDAYRGSIATVGPCETLRALDSDEPYVERITDANGDETERGADSDATASEDQPQPTSEAPRRAMQRAADLVPCPDCGGDRLRADFTTSPTCHAPFPARQQGEDRTDTSTGRVPPAGDARPDPTGGNR